MSAALGRLGDELTVLSKVVVAFSGGADSSLLAWAATDVLGAANALCVTAVSESLAPSELEDCEKLALEWGLRWQTVQTSELERPEYVRNDEDRCYHCKAELMGSLSPLARLEGAVVTLGVNTDDLADPNRPGQRAAAEAGAAFPLARAGMRKEDVREMSRRLGLRTWDKPAAACLASRVPHGTPVSAPVLSQVAVAERRLRSLGFSQLRVRHHGDVARLELTEAELEVALERRTDVIEALHGAGYRFVTLDLEGFRSGSLSPPSGSRA